MLYRISRMITKLPYTTFTTLLLAFTKFKLNNPTNAWNAVQCMVGNNVPHSSILSQNSSEKHPPHNAHF